jgi:hypothetical protein
MHYTNLGQIQESLPPETISGMVRVELDTSGHLLSLIAVPPQFQKNVASDEQPDPAGLFASAGLDFKSFQPTAPLWAAPVASNQRLAWASPFPGYPDPLRVEAAWWDNKPVWFHVFRPWALPHRIVGLAKASDSYVTFLQVAQNLILWIASGLLAWRNLRIGRGDRSGAWRLSVFTFVIGLVSTLLSAHGLLSTDGLTVLNGVIAKSLLTAGRLWLVYLALEPTVRRRWPRILISWSRIATGKWQDPMVGRDILAGILVGLCYTLIAGAALAIIRFRGGPPLLVNTDDLLGLGAAINGILGTALNAIATALLSFLLLFVLRLLVRKEWLAAVAFAVLIGTAAGIQSDYATIMIPAFVMIYGAIGIVLLRFGIVSLVSAIFTVNVLNSLFFTLHFSAWYGTGSLVVLAVVTALAAFAFRQSIGQQRLLSAWLEN